MKSSSGFKAGSGFCEIWFITGIVMILSVISEASPADEDISKTIEARSLLSDMAREIITRSGSSSQVLSLNLTNLIILLVLKGLLFGAALIGSGHHKARKLDESSFYDSISQNEPYVSESEVLLVLSYLMGETNQNYDCLKRVACLDPKKAREYLFAGKFVMGTVRMFQNIVPIDEKYDKLLQDIQSAANIGKNGGVCRDMYTCTKQNDVE